VTGPVEAEVQWAWEFDWYRGPLRITDAQGNDMPCQVIREFSVIPGFRARVVFQARIPSLGYRTFLVHQEPSRDEGAKQLAADDRYMESDCFKVKICRETGCIASIFDKVRGREVLRNAAKAVVRQDDGDTWGFNISGYGEARECFKMDSASLVENGPVRTVVRTKGRYGNSHLEQDFILYRDSDVIDGSFRVNWREKQKVLKLTFDTLQTVPIVTSSIPYGSVTRKADGCEYPMGEWVDISSDEFGISLLSDSVFAYDVQGGVGEVQEANVDESLKETTQTGRSNGATVGLTLLRSAIFGDLRIEPIDLDLDYDVLGQGISEGKWRMVLHEGSWRDAKTPQLAMQFNNPPVVVVEANHAGTRPQEVSFIQMKSDSTILTTAKASEEGDGLVLRMFEYAGNDDMVQVTANCIGSTFEAQVSTYEIKTLLVDKTGCAKETNMLEK